MTQRARDAIVETLRAAATIHGDHLQASTSAFAALLRTLGSEGPRTTAQPAAAPAAKPTVVAGARPAAQPQEAPCAPGEQVFDPMVETWVWDHCPSYVLPVVPGMWMFDRLISAAQAHPAAAGREVVQVSGARIHGWLLADRARRLRVVANVDADGSFDCALEVWRESARADLSRFEPVATGRVTLDSAWPTPAPALPPLDRACPLQDVYRDSFLGPCFQLVTDAVIGDAGGTAWVDLDRSGVPPGVCRLDALDAAMHIGVPEARRRWFPELDDIALPRGLIKGTFHGPPPAGGVLRCEMRRDETTVPTHRTSVVRVQIYDGDRLWADYRLEQILLKATLDGAHLAALLRDGRFVRGARWSRQVDAVTVVDPASIASADWPRGTLARAFGLDPDSSYRELARDVAIKEHVAHAVGAHPSRVAVQGGGLAGAVAGQWIPLVVSEDGDGVITVRDRPEEHPR